MIKLFDEKNPGVRTEANQLSVELYRWIKGGLKSFFSDLRSAQLKELENLWAKVEDDTPTPMKTLKTSQAPKETEKKENVKKQEILLDLPTFEVLSTIKSDWYEKMSSGYDNSYKGTEDERPKPVKVRVDCLNELNKKLEVGLSKKPLLATGDYNQLINVLVKYFQEPQLLVSQAALECLEHIVKGLKSNFSPYVSNLITPLLSKFKEKKPQTTASIHTILEEIDTNCKSFTEFIHDISDALKQKVPQTKENVMIFIENCLKKRTLSDISKQFKLILSLLMEQIDEANGGVRDSALKAFSRMMLISEKDTKSFYDKFDASKQKKITEFIKGFGVQKNEPKKRTLDNIETSPVKNQKKVKMSNTVVPTTQKVQEKTVVPKTVTTKSKGPPKKTETEISINPLIPQESIEEKFNEFIPENIRNQCNEQKWEERKKGLDNLENSLSGPLDPYTSEYLIRGLLLKKETNMFLLVKLFEVFKKILEETTKPSGYTAIVLLEQVLKHIGTPKLKDLSKELLIQLSTSLNPQFILINVVKLLSETKSPLVITEIIIWVGESIGDFGIKLFTTSTIVESLKPFLDNSNVKIKKATISSLCILKKFIGDSLIDSFSDLKPALLSVLREEFTKTQNETNFVPKRVPKGVKLETMEMKEEEEIIKKPVEQPRVDISQSITKFIEELDNPNWKTRAQGISSIEKCINEANSKISPSIGDLFTALKKRLDSENHSKVLIASLNLLGLLATSIGTNSSKFYKNIVPNMMNYCYSSKPEERKAVFDSLDLWIDQIGVSSILKYIATSLSQEKGISDGKKDILIFLSKHVSNIKKGSESIDLLVKSVMNCLDGNNGDNKKIAESIVLKLSDLLGMEMIKSFAKDTKGNSQRIVLQLLNQDPKSPRKNTSRLSTSSRKSFSPSPSPKSQGPILIQNNLKSKREENLNQWNIDYEIKEQVHDTLRSEMSNCISFDIQLKLYSNNQSEKIEAYTRLIESVKEKKELIENIDLILKICSLDLVDSNSTIVCMTLKLLSTTFKSLKELSYQLSNGEADIIIPNLLESFGNRMIIVRNDVMPIVELLHDIHSLNRLPLYIIKGLTSYNSFTKISTLNYFKFLIQTHGTTFFNNDLITSLLLCIDDCENVRKVALETLTFILPRYNNDINILFSLVTLPTSCKRIIEERVRHSTFKNVSKEKEIKIPQLDIALEENSIIKDLRNVNIKDLSIENIQKCVNIFKNFGLLLESKETGEIITHLKETVTRLSYLFLEAFQQTEPNHRLCKYVLSCLILLFENNQIGNLVSTEELERLIDIIINITIENHLSKIQEGTMLLKGTTSLLNQIMNNSSQTNFLTSSIHLLGKATHQEKSNQYFEMIIKCLLKITKDISTLHEKIDFDILLLDIHEYLTNFPPSQFKGKSDLPFRTIKSVLNEVVRFKGPSIRTHLSLIPTHKNPLIVNYIELMLKSNDIKPIEQKKIQVYNENEKEIINIFQLIKKEDPNGVFKLYKYSLENPSFDYSSHLNLLKDPLKESVLKQLDLLKKKESSTTSIDSIRAKRKMSIHAKKEGNEITQQELSSIRSRLMALGGDENLFK